MYNLGHSLYIGQERSNRWRFAVPIFREGFAWHILTFLISTTNKRECQKCSSKDLQASNWHLKMCTLSKKSHITSTTMNCKKTNLQSLGQSLNELPLVYNFWTEYFWKIYTRCSWETRHILWFSHDCREIPWTAYLTKSLSENITIALNCWLIAPIKQLRRGGNPVLVHNGAKLFIKKIDTVKFQLY